ncbi:MAG: T9SS type A sorting domain-containing protein [Paludibacteraceae bacterium]
MKKIYILMIFSLIVSVGIAQGKKSQIETKLTKVSDSRVREKANFAATKSNIPQSVSVNTDQYVATSFNSVKSAVKAAKAASADVTVLYGRPDGTFYTGFYRDYSSYGGVYLQTPAMVPVDYIPYASDATATFAWNYNGGTFAAIDQPIDADGTLHNTSGITPSGYIMYIPKVTATTATSTASFVTGTGSNYQYVLAANVERDTTADGTSLDGAMEYWPLTLANMHERKYLGSTSYNLWGGYAAGGSFSPAYSNTNGPCVGVMQVIPQLKSPFYVESISALAYEDGGTAVPEGGVMKLELYYLNEDGSLGNKIAESTTSEFEKTYTDQGAFIFKFQKEEDGFIVDTPVTIDTIAPVAVIITGFDSTWHFKFLFGSNRTEGSSYTLHGSNLAVSTFGYSNAPTVPAADLYIQFNGILNCLVPFDENTNSLTFPSEGGYGVSGHSESGDEYNDISVYSSYNIDEYLTDIWIDSAPEWVSSVEFDSTYFADYNILSFFFKADALPTSAATRSGEIVISSYGVSLKVPVTQLGTTGIYNPKQSEIRATAVDNSFKIKYPNSYNSVSVFTTSGQKLGQYSLTSSGEAIIPGASSNGIYILKFTGAKTETIKVIK